MQTATHPVEEQIKFWINAMNFWLSDLHEAERQRIPHLYSNLPLHVIGRMMDERIPAPMLHIGGGRKYIEIMKTAAHIDGAKIFAFIRASDGAILSPASPYRPAPGARGSIYDEDVTVACTPDGPKNMPGTGAHKSEMLERRPIEIDEAENARLANEGKFTDETLRLLFYDLEGVGMRCEQQDAITDLTITIQRLCDALVHISNADLGPAGSEGRQSIREMAKAATAHTIEVHKTLIDSYDLTLMHDDDD